MRLLERQGRSGGRVHWLDLLILVMVLTVMVRTIINSWPRFDRREERKLRLEVVIFGLPADLAESLAVGQWVKDHASGEFIGKISRKEATPPRRAARAFGELDRTALREEQDVLLILERTGRLNEREGIFCGREVVRAGQERLFHTLYTEFTGRINRISVMNE